VRQLPAAALERLGRLATTPCFLPGDEIDGGGAAALWVVQEGRAAARGGRDGSQSPTVCGGARPFAAEEFFFSPW
jgi:hypothetical protein